MRPFDNPRDRLLIIVGLIAIVALVAGFRYLRARRANARLIGKLMDGDGLVSLTDTQSQEEVGILRERFEDALKILRETRIDTARGRSFLLDLPWYVDHRPARLWARPRSCATPG